MLSNTHARGGSAPSSRSSQSRHATTLPRQNVEVASVDADRQLIEKRPRGACVSRIMRVLVPARGDHSPGQMRDHALFFGRKCGGSVPLNEREMMLFSTPMRCTVPSIARATTGNDRQRIMSKPQSSAPRLAPSPAAQMFSVRAK